MTTPFTSSFACRSHAHCVACRSRTQAGEHFRASVAAHYAAPAGWKCPHRIAWGIQTPPCMPPPPITARVRARLRLGDRIRAVTDRLHIGLHCAKCHGPRQRWWNGKTWGRAAFLHAHCDAVATWLQGRGKPHFTS